MQQFLTVEDLIASLRTHDVDAAEFAQTHVWSFRDRVPSRARETSANATESLRPVSVADLAADAMRANGGMRRPAITRLSDVATDFGRRRSRLLRGPSTLEVVAPRTAEPGTLRGYVRTHSVVAGAGSVVACANDELNALSVPWQIVQVKDIDDNSLLPSATEGWGFGTGTVLPKRRPFNAEEVGYSWPEVVNAPVLAHWPSGLYAVELTQPSGPRIALYFVVRPPTPTRKILLCLPWATTVAYAGGKAATHSSTYNWGDSSRLRRVSLDRPLDTFPYGDNRGYTHRDPFKLCKFLRDNGFEVDLWTSFDLHQESIPANYNLFISAGHDEYWSKAMRDHVEEFVTSGGNVAFFSGNVSFGQVRFEDNNRTLVCYKNAVEDPLVGIDDANVTVVPSGWPVDRPENGMTGVSTRRGTVGATAAYEVVRSDGVFAQTTVLPGSTIAMCSFEADGMDLELAGGALPPFDPNDPNKLLPLGTYRPTGRDGTPLSFKVLAVADGRAPSASMIGTPTIGYYSKGGTVFTASTADWCGRVWFFALPNEVKLTLNVVNWLIARFPGDAFVPPPARPPMPGVIPDPSSFEGATMRPWAPLGASTGTAIGATCLGHLYVATGDGKVGALDAENPTGALAATNIPELPGIRLTSLTSTLHGRDLFAAAATTDVIAPYLMSPVQIKGGLTLTTTTILQRVADPTSHDGWTRLWAQDGPGEGSRRCLGLGACDPSDSLFIAVEEADGRWLYTSNPEVKVGRWPDRFVALTGGGFDGRLYAATEDGDLMSRDGGNTGVAVDLVWRRIGSVPPNTFSLACALGRLYALAGTPGNATLHWRPAVADVPLREPSLLFLDGVGNAMVGMLSCGGNFTIQNTILVTAPTDLVTRAGNGLVFFLGFNGDAVLGRFDRAGSFRSLQTWASFSVPSLGGPPTFVGYAWNGRILLHNVGTARTAIGRFEFSGPYNNPGKVTFKEEWSGHVGSGSRYTQIVPLNDGSVLLYNPSTGWCMVVRFGDGTLHTLEQQGPKGAASVVAAGQTFALFYWKAGNAELWESSHTTFEPRAALPQDPFNYPGPNQPPADLLPVGNENGVVLLKARSPNASLVRGVRAGVNPTSLTFAFSTLHIYGVHYDPFVGTWPHIISIGVL